MDKVEARDVLYRAGICEVHGVKKVWKMLHLQYSVKVCPQCVQLEKSKEQTQVEEALKVLGLKGGA